MVVEYGNVDKNLRVLDELVERFRNRAPQPIKGWPDFDTYLDSMRFPSHILTDGLLAKTLEPHRISAIRDALLHPGRDGRIRGQACRSWTTKDAIEDPASNLIYSTRLLEHVVDVPTAFRCAARLAARDGWNVPPVDFTFHGVTRAWNGHWQYPEWLWKIIVGGRPFLTTGTRDPPNPDAGSRRLQDRQARCATTATTGCLDPSSACPGKTC